MTYSWENKWTDNDLCAVNVKYHICFCSRQSMGTCPWHMHTLPQTQKSCKKTSLWGNGERSTSQCAGHVMWASLTMQALHMMQCGPMHWLSIISWKRTSPSCQTSTLMCQPSECLWKFQHSLMSCWIQLTDLFWCYRRFVEMLEATDFHGVSGRIRFLGASRVSDINIVQWLDNRTQVVGSFHPNISTVHQEISGGM